MRKNIRNLEMTIQRISFSIYLVLALFSCNKVPLQNNNPNSDITITSLSPAHGPFDTIDTLIGKGFEKIPEIDSVLLNGKKLTLISKSPEQLIVKIPSLAGTGNIDIWFQGKLIRGPVFTYDSLLFVTTIAGSSSESGAINGKGLNARFNELVGIAVDQSGQIFVVDKYNNSIRKIDTLGDVTTVAGSLNGMMNYSDGTGSDARFAAPLGLALGNDGFLYVADQFNYRVRKVSPSGQVTTLAGLSWNTLPPGGQIDGDKTVATFNTPFSVTTDLQQNVYVADSYNNKIRKITPTGYTSTFAGGDYYNRGHKDGSSASALFYSPSAVAADLSGNIYVIDGENHLLRKITTDGMVTTLLGPLEPAITGYNDLFSTGALAVDKAGNVFFSIRVGIIKMTPDGKIIRYAVGGTGITDGPVQVATYSSINGIAIDNSGNLFITDKNRVRKIAWQ